MPKREEAPKEIIEEELQDGTEKEPSGKTTIKAKPVPVEAELLEFATLGANYVRLKKEETKLKADITKQNTIIKNKAEQSSLFDMNGDHRELYAPLGDGLNEVFIQIQSRKSVSPVANIVQLVRDKLGDKADNFIMMKEVLHDTALEAMVNQGLITPQELLDWTTTNETKSLIVKVNKKRN